MTRTRATSKRIHGLLFALAVAIAIVTVIFGMKGIRDQTRRDLKDDLQTVLSTTQNALNIWARETEKRVFLWANVKETKINVKSQIRLLHSLKKGSWSVGLNKSQAHHRLFAELSKTVRANDYLGYVVIDPDGRILSASQSNLLGENTRSLVNITNPQMREPVITPPFWQNGELIPNHPIISMAVAPILSNGKTIAFLGFLLDPAASLTKTTQLGRIGNTGETYALDQAGFLVTNSRFEDSLVKAGLISPGQNAILRVQVRDPGVNLIEGERPKKPREQQPFTKMAQSVLQHQAGTNLDGYRDYRGIKVVGAWIWSPILNLGLVTEIDVNEAYRSYFITRALVFVMLGLTIFCAIVVESGLWLQSRTLARTVKRLEKTRHILQQTIQARNEFISIAAHELRTPLTSLRLQVNLIHNLAERNAICDYPRDKLIRITRVSSTELERFSKIIRNLLDVSQVSGGGFSLELQEFDWMKTVHDIRFQYLQQLERNGCSLRVRGPASVIVRWDRSQMEQVLTNLLSNAIKYGKGKPIEIDVRELGQWIEISVTDHGIGIKSEDQAKVFDKFERAGVINPEGGLGLGLYLVRKIIQRHHGTVDVKSKLGMGSTFTLKVPKIVTDKRAQEPEAA